MYLLFNIYIYIYLLLCHTEYPLAAMGVVALEASINL